MKKFLTVLLALSVVFTYSFSSVGAVFAAEAGYDDAQLIKQATAYAKTELSKNIEKAYKDVVADEKNAYISEAAWEAMSAEMLEIYEARYDAAEAAYLSDDSTLPAGWNKYPNNLAEVADALYHDASAVTKIEADYETFYTGFSGDSNSWAVKAAKEQFKLDFDNAIALYDKVDLDALYSKSTPEDESYYEKAVKAIMQSKETLKTNFFNEDGTVKHSAVTTASPNGKVSEVAATEKKLVEGIIPEAGTETITGVTKIGAKYYEGTANTVVQYYYLVGIPTIVDEDDENAEIEATTAAVKAQIAKNVAVFLKTNKTSADKAFAEDYATFYNYLAEKITLLNAAGKGKLASDVVAHESQMTVLSQGPFPEQIAEKIAGAESMEAFGAKYAAEKDASGALARDPEEVAKLVEKAIVAEYAGLVGMGVKDAYSFEEAENEISSMTTKGDAAKLAFDKEAKKSDLDDALEAALDDYYALEAAQVKAVYAAAKEKVDAVKDTKEFAAIDAELKAAVDKIKDKSEVEALFTGGKMKTELGIQVTELVAYINYKNTNAAPYDDSYVLGANNASTLLRDYYIENDARTVEEMKALTAAVESVAATLPTTGTLAAAKKAAEDAIKALPTAAKTTSADKAAYQNAFDLAQVYNKMQETATGKKGVLAISNAQLKALTDAIQKDFYEAYAKTTKTDKAALKAIAADVKKANEELTADDKMLETFTFVNPAQQDLANIKLAEKKAVIAAIKALPINVTLADKAQIEAARALYDAYVAEYMDYTDAQNGYVPVEFKDDYRELALAEAALSVLEKDAAKKATESLKLSVSTKLYKNSKIRVNWKVKGGDASYIDGYQVWKSKKAQSGYSYMGKTKKLYMDNKKGLKQTKKGTRMYYKVRAFVEVDGQKYYSDWSNKGNRIWR